MSRAMIEKIKEVETEAQRIRAEAEEEAKERIRQAEAVGRLLCAEAETQARASNAEKLEMTRRKADELLVRARRESAARTQSLTEADESFMRDAVRLIIGGIMEQCQ